ncbi:O-antigen ligase family protein [uncultured Sunxiuqinia sp.]|uniref:O-antigen ligase family protein n=1 Tax=uncultured Sunxiuqinia sp. TaxID=1573825 RepID=UPI002AA8EF7A|nr:O-antigen ligase family protein [uncultured Sunxiuqinia sp.]
MTKLDRINFFYVAMLVFVVALPFSEGLISTSIGLLFLASLFQLKKIEIKSRFRNHQLLLYPVAVFLVYVLWLIFTNDWHWAIYDLKKNLSYLLIPTAFIFAPSISAKLQQNVLYVFVVAVFISALITFVYFYLQDENSLLEAQKYGFIHHIRFSFQLVLSLILIPHFLLVDFYHQKKSLKLISLVGAIFLIIFLIWHQSLTGVLTFIGTAFLALLILSSHIKKPMLKRIIFSLLLVLVIAPSVYLAYAVKRFYTVEKVTTEELAETTQLGNNYSHNFENKLLENGHYVWLFVCEKELESEWNKRADIKYDGVDKTGYPVSQTLIRYVTSKGLRKDADGIRKLSDQDIENIEHGISNYIFAEKGISLYPRIYMSIWEIDTYLKTRAANQHSLAQRIEYTRAAITIIQDHFWLGVGTGNWKKAYAEAYETNQSKMDPARYGNAHNQYLNYMVKFGFIGLLLITFFIVYPVVKSKAYRSSIFLLFLISMFIANFGDSNFETHVGSNFFIFFYCFFLFPWIDKSSDKLIQ